MTKLTEFEKQKAITCVGYIEGKFRCDRYKLEMEYDKLGHYDEELDKKLEHAKKDGRVLLKFSRKIKGGFVICFGFVNLLIR